MIPWAHIVGWRSSAPWISDAQVEQDLIMSRALVAIFQEPVWPNRWPFVEAQPCISCTFSTPRRYSEDIDLVQIKPGGIGPTIDMIQGILGEFLEKGKKNG